MTTVLVTGAGGAAGVAVVRALVDRGTRTVAVDTDPLAAGLFLADEHATVPLAGADGYAHALADVVKRFEVDAVICTVAEEMFELTGCADALAEAGAATWLSPRGAIARCVDKLHFAAAMSNAAIPVPATARACGRATIPGPWIVKPRFGRGSRDVYPVDDADELDWACRRVPEAIVQTRIAGREFTVDLLVGHDGVVAGAIPRWRLETKAGISTKGRTFADADLIDVASRATRALGLQGAANLQGFVDEQGAVWVIEVNPRVSGGLPLTLAAGADLVGELVRGTLGLRVRPERLRPTTGVTMTRHYDEVFV